MRYKLKPLVLIVDDDTLFISDLTLLMGERYHCVPALSEKQVFSRLSVKKADVILLDVHLNKEKDGFSILKKLNEKEMKIPVIMMSDKPSIEVVVKAMELGAFSFIPKNSGLKDLMKTIEKVLEKK